MYIGNYIIHCIYLFFRIYRAAVDSVDFVDSMVDEIEVDFVANVYEA